MIVRDACPACGSTRFKKNGHTHNGKQKHQCKACPRQFVQCSEPYRISDETRALIERLLARTDLPAGHLPRRRGRTQVAPGFHRPLF